MADAELMEREQVDVRRREHASENGQPMRSVSALAGELEYICTKLQRAETAGERLMLAASVTWLAKEIEAACAKEVKALSRPEAKPTRVGLAAMLYDICKPVDPRANKICFDRLPGEGRYGAGWDSRNNTMTREQIYDLVTAGLWVMGALWLGLVLTLAKMAWDLRWAGNQTDEELNEERKP